MYLVYESVQVKLASARFVASLEIVGSCKVTCVQADFQGNLRRGWKPQGLYYISCRACWVGVRADVPRFSEAACSDGDRSGQSNKENTGEKQHVV